MHESRDTARASRLPITATIFTFALAVALLAVGLFATPAEAAEFEVVVSELQQSKIYIEDGAEEIDATVVNNAIANAAACDIDLHIVILATDADSIDAKSLRERIGDVTVVLFRPSTFNLATSDIGQDRFNEAKAIANVPLSEADADVAVSEFIDAACSLPESNSSGLPWFVWPLILLGGLALLGLLAKVFASSSRSARKADEFEKRRQMLREWSGELRAPVTELQGPVASAKSSALATMYNEALGIARETDGELDAATTEPELDRIEMRVARAWTQLRDIRATLRD